MIGEESEDGRGGERGRRGGSGGTARSARSWAEEQSSGRGRKATDRAAAGTHEQALSRCCRLLPSRVGPPRSPDVAAVPFLIVPSTVLILLLLLLLLCIHHSSSSSTCVRGGFCSGVDHCESLPSARTGLCFGVDHRGTPYRRSTAALPAHRSPPPTPSLSVRIC